TEASSSPWVMSSTHGIRSPEVKVTSLTGSRHGTTVLGSQHGAEGHHQHEQGQVEPVVSVVERHEVGGAGLVDDQSIDPKQAIDQTATDEEHPRAGERPRRSQPPYTEQQMNDVVEDRHLEDAEEHRP